MSEASSFLLHLLETSVYASIIVAICSSNPRLYTVFNVAACAVQLAVLYYHYTNLTFVCDVRPSVRAGGHGKPFDPS